MSSRYFVNISSLENNVLTEVYDGLYVDAGYSGQVPVPSALNQVLKSSEVGGELTYTWQHIHDFILPGNNITIDEAQNSITINGLSNIIVIANDDARPSAADVKPNNNILYITSDFYKIWQNVNIEPGEPASWIQLNSGGGDSYTTDQFLALYDSTSNITAEKTADDKLKLTGSVVGGVSSVIAGSGISVDQATGDVTVTNSNPNVQSDWDATSGSSEILNKPTIPTVNNATITIKQDGVADQTFTLNQSSNQTITIAAAVVNNQILKEYRSVISDVEYLYIYTSQEISDITTTTDLDVYDRDTGVTITGAWSEEATNKYKFTPTSGNLLPENWSISLIE
jgi:hypothetical protein